MKEAEFLGGLIPSSPDFEPLIKTIREKYSLVEIYPDDAPNKDIILDDEIISIEEFTKDVRNQIIENLDTLLSEEFANKYRSAKKAIDFDYSKELVNFSEDIRPSMQIFFEMTKNFSSTVYITLDAHIDEIVRTVCQHLLLGDSPKAPEDWFGKLIPSGTGSETIIYAIINKLTNLDFMFQEIRSLHRKTFGVNPYKINKSKADTAYYLQLKLRKKDNDFILDEFIRLNKISLPRERNSPRYFEVRNKVWQRLKKRLKTAQSIIEAISREKN